MSGQRLASLALTVLASCSLSCSGPDREGAGERPPAKGCEGVSCSLDKLLEGSEQREPWQVRETPSFRIFHYDALLADRIAVAAEGQRRRQLETWLGESNAPVSWSPRCDLYVFPSTRLMQRLAGGRDGRAGAALTAPSRLYRGRIVSRRIDLAADDGSLFARTLPHEIAHVVLDTLLAQELPIWAHEGVATLEQPEEDQQASLAFAADEQAAGRGYSVKALMEMRRYPDREYLQLFYAQSFSLVRLLVAARGRPAFLAFLRAARPGLEEPALRQHYGWSYLELQRRWTAGR